MPPKHSDVLQEAIIDNIGNTLNEIGRAILVYDLVAVGKCEGDVVNEYLEHLEGGHIARGLNIGARWCDTCADVRIDGVGGVPFGVAGALELVDADDARQRESGHRLKAIDG